MATFAKLKDGSWGLRGGPDELKEGQTVVVQTKAGGRKQARVGRIVWRGDDAVIATIAGPPGDTPRVEGGATTKQVGTLRKMLARLTKVDQFDSYSGSGLEVAEPIFKEVEKAGGYEKLTGPKCSELIDAVRCLLDDEM